VYSSVFGQNKANRRGINKKMNGVTLSADKWGNGTQGVGKTTGNRKIPFVVVV